MPDLVVLSNQLKAVVLNAANKLKSYKKNSYSIDLKGKNDLVTEVDKKVEEFLKVELMKLLPEAGFFGEEFEALNINNEYLWVVDPIDGTTNFVYGIPCYSISIALCKNRLPVIGMVYEINMQELFYAIKGKGAYCNDIPIHVSKETKLKNAFVATGFPYKNFALLDAYIAFFKDLLYDTRGVRRLGSAAVDLAYVAAGRFDVFFEYGLQPYDIAAGILIVEEAGGKVTDFNNEIDVVFKSEIVASNAYLHEEFITKLKKYV